MCIVIDADVFSSLANARASMHSEFRPLFEWVSFGKGKVVYGGTKYAEELAKNGKFRGWLFELEKKKKTVFIEKERIDYTSAYLTKNASGPYNDYHIAAIVIVSGCKLVCSLDKGLHNLINVCYQQRLRKLIKRDCPCMGNLSHPKIYQNKGHRILLCDKNIAKCCQ